MNPAQHAVQAATQASAHQNEAVLFLILLQLAVIVLAARVGGWLACRAGQSPAVGEIIVGIVLGPSLFGALAPGAFHFVFLSAPPQAMNVLSQLGLILLMFQIGLEFDFAHLRVTQNRTATFRVALACIALPFVLGLGFGYWSAPVLSPQAPPVAAALFVATAFSITALPILGRILMEFNMTRTHIGVIAISAAAINDVIGWLLLALVTALASAQFEWWRFGLRVFAVAVFALASWFLLRPLFKRLIVWLAPELRRTGALNGSLMAALLIGVFGCAMITYQIGIFAIFGGFAMGVLLHDEVELVAAWRDKVGTFVLVFFLPIFFTYTGLRTHIGALNSLGLWGWCALAIFLASFGKMAGAYGAARWSGLDRHEAGLLAILMNTRALMELIVINVGFDLGVISQNVFTMLVLMAIVSTVLTTPGLRASLPRLRLGAAAAAP
jgi:Kef-type K+ transport system membrane component KefB